MSETQTGRDKALEKGKEDVLKLLRGKRSQEVKEKEGKRKSEENGNGVGGRVVSRGRWIRGGGRKQEESYNAAVVSVSCVPQAGSPDWSARAPGGTFIPQLVLLERDSFESEDKDSLGTENDKMVIVERCTLNGAGSFLTVGLWKIEIA